MDANNINKPKSSTPPEIRSSSSSIVAPIVFHITELYKEVYKTGTYIPKLNRFGIWQQVEKTALACLRLSLEASLSSRDRKPILIRELRLQVEIIKHLCRLCVDIKVIEQKKYILIQEKLQEISKMASGWEKYLRT